MCRVCFVAATLTACSAPGPGPDLGADVVGDTGDAFDARSDFDAADMVEDDRAADVDDVANDVLTDVDAAEPVDVLNETDPANADADVAQTDGDSEDAVLVEPWRSTLYPLDWSPPRVGTADPVLHDFSYAGYRNGETPPLVEGPVFDVVEFGGDPSGSLDSSAAVAAAIAAASEGGGVVFFASGLYRMDERVRVEHSRVVLRGEGAEASRLWFTGGEAMDYSAHLAIGRTPTWGAQSLLVADGARFATEVVVDDASILEVGDIVALGWNITPDYVADYGMAGVWRAFNDTWQPFALRTVVGIDLVEQRVVLDVPLRSDALVRDGAALRVVNEMIVETGVENLGISNATEWTDAWSRNQVHAISMTGVADGWIRDVASFATPGLSDVGDVESPHLQSGGIVVSRSMRVTISNVSLERAQNRGGGRNGYLFELRQSSEILTRDSSARSGRHNFIQNWGFGLTGCVWLRVTSEDGVAAISADLPIGPVGYSETHHSLATANLVDASRFDDGWSMVNRQDYSTGAGITATEMVVWAASGTGLIESRQFGLGYVIGTSPSNRVEVSTGGSRGEGTAPTDIVEGEGRGQALVPASLYDDQRARRLAAER